MKKIILLIGLIALAVALSGCTQPVYEGRLIIEKEILVKVNQVYQTNRISEENENTYIRCENESKEGFMFIVAEMNFENIGKESHCLGDTILNGGGFKIQDEEGRNFKLSNIPGCDDFISYAPCLVPTEKASKKVAFEIPAQTKEIKILYGNTLLRELKAPPETIK